MTGRSLRKFWDRLPVDLQEIVNRNVRQTVARQRSYTNGLNQGLQKTLTGRGQIFNVADVAISFGGIVFALAYRSASKAQSKSSDTPTELS